MGLCESPEALTQFVICCILGGGINVCDGHLAVVELLDDGLVLLVDVTHTDELGLAVSLEEALSESLHYSRRRASAGNRTVLDVPEHPDGWQCFGLQRTCDTERHTPNTLHRHNFKSQNVCFVCVRTVFLCGFAEMDPQQTVRRCARHTTAVAHRDRWRDVRPDLLRVNM